MLELEIAPRAAQEAPKRPQERQEAGKRRQDSAERRQESAKRRQDAPKSDFGSHLGSNLDPPGTPKPSKTIEKTRVLKNFVFFQRRRKKRPKELPKEAPGKPKRLPGAPRERPGAAQEAQRQRQERPRATQERPKSRPRGEQKEQKRRFRSWGGLGRPPGAILKRFGSDLGASGVAFWSRFQDFFFVSSDLLRPPAREAFQATPLQDAERGRGARPRSLTRMLC